MSRLLPVLLLASVLGFGLASGLARADPKVPYLVEQLRTSEDYRVRTQAALALGASGEDAAVKPLCGALDDGNASVRAAAAAALGKLGKPAGAPCLKAAGAKETTPAV
jgi:HEAT repeat protein